ncbi:MAG: FimV/HubP family polar landmark protein [Pseudomonadota bacterium]
MLRKILLVGLGLSAHASALALGLGEIQLDSALNQPLVAEIPINVASRDELRGFEARVALNDTFARYGLDRPVFLNSLRFRVTNNAAGQPVLAVTSTRPIAEPFVTFLLEATWDSGRLLREYTVLLDPPVFSEESVAAPVNTAQSVTSLPSNGGRITSAPAPSPLPAPAPVYRQPAITGQTYGPVQRNQNLWNISKSVQLDGVTINQMMVAIYRANPQAFLGNINLLKEGSTLQIPDAASVRNLLRSDANSVVVAHNADWQSGRVSGGGNRVAASSSDSGTRNTRLKLVAPEGSEAGAGSGSDALDATRELLNEEQAENARLSDELDSVRDELADAQRMISLKNSELAELQQSLGQTADSTSTDAVSDSAGAEPVAAVDAPDDAESSVDAGPATDEVDETTAAVSDPTRLLDEPKPAAKPPVVVDTPSDEPSLMSSIMGVLTNWLFLIPLALLGILGTLYVMFRNRGEETVEPWDAIEADDDDANLDLDASLDKIAQQTMAKDTANISAREVEYFEDTGTFKPIDFDSSDTGQVPALSADDAAPFEDTLAGETGVKLDQTDALSEADFHMAYGLYDQAAELVGKAAEQEPERVDLKMKLLEIFFVWGNKDEFQSHAAAAKDMLSAHAGEWEKIMIMGKQICPGEELFAGEASGDAMADDVDLQLMTASTDVAGIDFETDDFGGEDVFAEQPEDAVDLDLGEALVAADDAPTAAGADSNALDFSFDEEGISDDSPTETQERVRAQIEEKLAETVGEDTEEMDLDELGIDLDFGDVTSVSEGTSGEFAVHDVRANEQEAENDEDFDELFDGLGDEDDAPSSMIDANMIGEEQTHDKLLDTSELKVEMEELLKADTSGLMDNDETARGVEALSDEDAPFEATGSFSAEIRSLASDELEIGEELAATSGSVDFGFGDADDDDDDETVLQEGLSPDAFETPVEADSDEETVIASTLVSDEGLDLSEPFGDPSQDTTAMPVIDETILLDGDVELEVEGEQSAGDADAETFHGVFGDDNDGTQAMPAMDDFSEDVFPSPEGRTQEMRAMDLDVGETVDDSGDNTTMRVATSNLALPENADLAVNEVGTKLDLARAYLDMGDPDGARGILEEVIQEGNDNQQADAQALLDGLS